MSVYKHGKKNNILSFSEIKQKVLDTKLSTSEAAYFWLLYYCGVRKSEGYERVAGDFKVTDTHLIVDFHQRKKGGAEVPPLELPRHWFGIDKIIECVEKAQQRKAHNKAVYTYIDRKRTRQLRKARWVFPQIQSTKAWEIIRKVLGKGWYPHFLRLNRLTEIGERPEASITEMKSFSGIKSLGSLQAYMGVSKKAQKKALDFMDQQMT